MENRTDSQKLNDLESIMRATQDLTMGLPMSEIKNTIWHLFEAVDAIGLSSKAALDLFLNQGFCHDLNKFAESIRGDFLSSQDATPAADKNRKGTK